MDIGEEQETIVIEPVESPVPGFQPPVPAPRPERAPAPEPEPKPEPVPA